MIKLSNGYELRYVVASGALGFDGRGYFWERPLVWLGLIKPELFTVVLKTLTRYPRRGNLHWWKPWTWLPFSPWSCIRFIPGGSVNKVGLTNKGVEWWCDKIASKIDFKKYHIIASIYGNENELVELALLLDRFPFIALEVNSSCPNTGSMHNAETVISDVKAVKRVSRHPLIVKLSVAQDYCAIAEGLKGIAEAISLNSVPWEIAFPEQKSPLWRLEEKVGGGGGGVSGEPAQEFNWNAVEKLANQGVLPVIGPDIMESYELSWLKRRGASAFSFGTIHLRTPWRPTSFVRREMQL